MAAPLHYDPIPFITLPNWVKAASQCGFNIEPVFRELGIETDLIHLESATISPPQMRGAMEACVARARQHHFPFVLGETFAFDYLPDISTFLATSPSLREALRVFEWVRELINPMLNVRVDERGAEAWLLLEFISAEPDPKLGPNPYFTETTFATIIKFGRIMLGEKAQFQRLCLRHEAPHYAAEYEKFFGTEVHFGQAEHALIFERSLLDVPLEGSFPALHRQAEYRVEQQLTRLPAKKSGLIVAVDEAFSARPQLIGQGIDALAAALKMHARTLQRRLQDEGQSYAELLARARFKLAVAWLQDDSLDIETVSERLGFSDRRSFTRAFSRWAGMSPSVFRRKAPID